MNRLCCTAFLFLVLGSAALAQDTPAENVKFVERAPEASSEAMSELIVSSMQSMLSSMMPMDNSDAAREAPETVSDEMLAEFPSTSQMVSLRSEASSPMRAKVFIPKLPALAKLLIPLLPLVIPGAAVLGKLALLFVLGISAPKLVALLPIAKVLGVAYGLKLKVLAIGALVAFKLLVVKLSLIAILLSGPLFLLALSPLLGGKLVPLTLVGLLIFLDCTLTKTHICSKNHHSARSQLNLISQTLMDAFTFQRDVQRSEGVVTRSDDLTNMMLALQAFEAAEKEYEDFRELAARDAPELLDVPLLDMVEMPEELRKVALTSASNVWSSTPGTDGVEHHLDMDVLSENKENLSLPQVESALNILTEVISDYVA